ncbi:hypothetical protein ANCCEY_11709 [Ancylostoma ceylanicum]|uniref:Uncharacterized protein n=1 Tax=Ancylostoma ceylanicum TaxID=53326 RepID=A0A0D6LAV4_9BILA|nr:hypothetical protein ANCCEY_11709 [Ancylostoma ceylanicum]
MERHAAFLIYHAIARAADKDSERKRRDEAREKKDEEEPTPENKEKAEAEQKKLAEEQKKKAEKLEKEKQEKKAALEKHYTMPKERKKKEEKKEKLDLKSMVSNRPLFESFAMFDVNLYLNERDLEDIIFNSELGVTRAQVQKLTHKLMSREKINYRHLTDVLVDSDGAVRFTPGECENPPDMSSLLKGSQLVTLLNYPRQ